MLRDLKKLIALRGIAWVATFLNYRSSSTISHWIKNKKIPAKAKASVDLLLRGESGR